MRHSFGLISLLAFSCMFVNISITRAADGESYILDHKTLYVAPKLGGAHRFEIKGGISGGKGSGTLLIDPNSCELNEFGDRTKCTEEAVTPIGVTITQLRLADPASEGREVYSINGKFPNEMKFTLVIGRKSKPEVLRLVVSVEENRSALPLVPRTQFDETK